MKVYLDDKEIFEITQTDLDLLGHELLDVQSEIERRIQWVIAHKCEQVFKRIKEEWIPKFLEAELRDIIVPLNFGTCSRAKV
jgi:hypothetical protein